MSDIVFGQLGTDEENTRYKEWRAAQLRLDARKRPITGDQPPDLTAEDERILDQAWREIAEEDAQPARQAA